MSDSSDLVIGWVGTGVMGCSMVHRLLEAGYLVTVTTRTRDRAKGLEKAGATWVDQASDLVGRVPVIYTMVGYPSDVEETYLGEHGILPAVKQSHAEDPLTIVDMTTSSPALAKRIAQECPPYVTSLDAPVSGGDIGARNGTLSIMMGGDAEAIDRIRPQLDVLGKTIRHQGPAGSGQHTKMVNQILIATNMIGVCEGLLYAEKAGLNPLQVLESVSTGAAGSWSVSNLAPRILANDFEPGFYVEHFIKDMGIALDEAARMSLPLPGLALARQLYESVRAHGWSRKGTQALYLALQALTGSAPSGTAMPE